MSLIFLLLVVNSIASAYDCGFLRGKQRKLIKGGGADNRWNFMVMRFLAHDKRCSERQVHLVIDKGKNLKFEIEVFNYTSKDRAYSLFIFINYKEVKQIFNNKTDLCCANNILKVIKGTRTTLYFEIPFYLFHHKRNELLVLLLDRYNNDFSLLYHRAIVDVEGFLKRGKISDEVDIIQIKPASVSYNPRNSLTFNMEVTTTQKYILFYLTTKELHLDSLLIIPFTSQKPCGSKIYINPIEPNKGILYKLRSEYLDCKPTFLVVVENPFYLVEDENGKLKEIPYLVHFYSIPND